MSQVQCMRGKIHRYARTDVVHNGDIIFKVFDNLKQVWIDVPFEEWNSDAKSYRTELMWIAHEVEIEDKSDEE